MTVDLGGVVSVMSWIANLARSGRTFAFVLVPVGVAFYWMQGYAILGGEPDTSDRVTVVNLNSSLVADGKVEAQEGLVAVFSPSEGKYLLSLESEPRSIATTLDTKEIRENYSRLEWQSEIVQVEMPLMGSRDPLTLVLLGESDGTLIREREKVPLDTIATESRGHQELLAACLMAVFFSYGVTIGSFSPGPFGRGKTRQSG